MVRRPPRSTLDRSSAASDVYKRQMQTIESIGKNWWKLLLRGILAVLFGVLAFAMPEVTVGLLALLFGLFVLADGIVETGYAFSTRDWWMLIPGFLGIAAGFLSLYYLQITAFVLLLIIAVWAIARGIVDIVTAIQVLSLIHISEPTRPY